MFFVSWYLLNKIQNILVVYEFYVTPIYFLFCVLFLLHLEYVLLRKMLVSIKLLQYNDAQTVPIMSF